MSNAIFSGLLQNYGTAGAAFDARTAVTVGIATRVVIPVGFQWVEPGANAKVQYTVDSGDNYLDAIAANGAGLIWSDGLSWSLLGDGSGGTAHRTRILGAD